MKSSSNTDVKEEVRAQEESGKSQNSELHPATTTPIKQAATTTPPKKLFKFKKPSG